jgi:hypothetical protein
MKHSEADKRGGRLDASSQTSRPSDTGSRSDAEIDPFEQVNFKVPRGTRLRVKRLALDEGGISMGALFMRMIDEYEQGRSAS